MGVLPSKILHPGWHANMSNRKPKPLSEKRIQAGFTQRKGQPWLLFRPLLDWGEHSPWEARREFFISSSCSCCFCGRPLCMVHGHPLVSLPDHWRVSLLCQLARCCGSPTLRQKLFPCPWRLGRRAWQVRLPFPSLPQCGSHGLNL